MAKVGDNWDRLTVIAELDERKSDGSKLWLCQCICGRTTKLATWYVNKRAIKSCGCLRSDLLREGQKIRAKDCKSHGLSFNPVYSVWKSMLCRCYDADHREYHRYGGQGITVCDRWKGPMGVVAFLADMGDRPSGMTLDRLDNEKGYSKENCRWATPLQQVQNRRCTIFVVVGGVRCTLKECSNNYGIKYETLVSRYSRGWRGEQLIAPLGKGGRKKRIASS